MEPDIEEGAVCIANIGPRERQKRMTIGVVMLVVSLGLAVGLIATGVARPWRLFLFLPLFGAGIGFFQAREKT